MKKILLALCAAVCAASLTVAACTTVVKKEFEAPEQPARKSLELGSDFSIPALTGKYGDETITPTVSVTHGGQAVETEGGGFRLDKAGEYTITYTFTYGDGQVYTMTQKVISVDEVAPTVVVGEMEGKYDYGETVTIPAITVADLSGETITPTVSVHLGSADGKTVNVTNNSFKIESYEQHFIVAEATDSSGNKGTGVASFAVVQEGELEFFNSSSYTLKNYLTDNTELAFNTDAQYIFEGEGSAHVTNTNSGAIYPGFILRNIYGTAFKGAVSAVMWVYNNSAGTVNLSAVVCEQGTEKIEEKGTIANFSAPAGIWTKMELSAEDLAKVGDQQFLKLYMGQNLNPELYAQLDLYFDAFKVYTADTLPAYSIEPQEILHNCEGEDEVTVLTADQLKGATDAENITAMLYNLETNESTPLKGTAQGIAIPAVSGNFKIYYLYQNGTDGVTAEQDVVLYDEATQHLYQKTYGLVDFEEKLALSDTEFYPAGAGNAVYSKAEEGGEHGNVLQIVNNPNSAWTFTQVKPYVAAQMAAGDSLKFDIKIEKTDGAVNYDLRIFKAGTETNIQSGKDYWLNKQTNFDEWITVEMTGEAVANIMNDGGFALYVIINGESASLYNYAYYLDNIRIVKSNVTEDGTRTLETILAEKFPSAEAEVLEIKDAEGAAYQLTEGKFTKSGTYQVRVKVSEAGYNANEYTLQISIAGADLIEDFEKPYDASMYHLTSDSNVAEVSISAERAYSGTQSLKVANGQWSGSTFLFVSLTDEMKAALTSESNLKLRLYLDKATSDGASYNLRITTTVNGQRTFFAYMDNIATGEWLEITFNTEDGGKPCNIMDIVEAGGFTVQIEEIGGVNSWAYNYYIDSLERITK